jgi:hypothetical protein
MAKLKAALPEGRENGLGAIEAALIADPESERTAIVTFDVCRITTNVDNGDSVPTVRLLRVEPVVLAPHLRSAAGLLDKCVAERTRQDAMIDLDTGEVL